MFEKEIKKLDKYSKDIKFKKYLGLSILEVTLPKETGSREEEIKDTKELTQIFLGNAEHFFANLYSIYKKESFSFFSKQDYLGFEIAAMKNEIRFFVVTPDNLQSLVEKLIHSSWPTASVEKIDGYNIFEPNCMVAAANLILSKKYIFPIKTYKHLESEPLNGITNALSKLAEHEGAAIQILIRPAGDRWRKSGQQLAKKIQEGKSGTPETFLLKILIGIGKFIGELFKTAVGSSAQQNQNIPEPVKLTPLQEEKIKALEEKTSKVGFQVNLRIISSSSREENAKSNLRNISSAFAQFSAPELNLFKEVKGPVKRIVSAFVFRKFLPSSVILNSEELASIFHFPNVLIETPHIKWLGAKKAFPPTNLPKEGTVLGESIYRGIKQPIRIKARDRRQHIYIIGKSGTGKTTLLSGMVLQDIKAGNGLCVVDPHGDLIEEIIPKIPKERAEDVIIFDPGDIERPLGLNLFEFRTPEQKDFLIQEAINMLYKLYDPGHTGIVGPRFERWFRNSALTLMADPAGGVFTEVHRPFIDQDFLEQKLKYVTDPTVRDFWTKEMAQTSDFHKSEILGWFTSKFDAFMTNEMMRNIVGQTKSSFDLREIMDSGKILLVNLSKGKVGELNCMLLGMIFVAKVQMAAMSRVNIPEDQRKDFYLYVDEFQNFATDSFATILSEARKYHLGLITANQYIGQLEEHVRESVFGNIGTIICFRVGPQDAEFLAKEFAPVFSDQDLVNIDRFNAYIKLLIDNTAVRPFSMQTIKDDSPSDSDVGKAIKQLSRLKYGRDKNLVEKEIFTRAKTEENYLPPNEPAGDTIKNT